MKMPNGELAKSTKFHLLTRKECPTKLGMMYL